MHVSGHVSTDHGPGLSAAPVTAHADMAADEVDAPATGGGGSELSLDVLAVCLAILASAGLAATVMAVLLVARRAAARPGRGGGARARRWSGRGPPRSSPPVGRRLAALSVLRI
jgi:hypothetical protein